MFVEGVRLVLFEGCGHYLHHEQPESFVRAVRSFLDDPSVSAARLRSAESQAERLPLAVK